MPSSPQGSHPNVLDARATALVAGALTTWAWASLVALAAAGRVTPAALGVVAAVSGALGLAAAWPARGGSRAWGLASGGLIGGALTLALAGHALHPRNAPADMLLLPDAAALLGAPLALGWVALVGLAFGAPTLGALRIRAQATAFGRTGRRASWRHALLLARPRALPLRWLEGGALLGCWALSRLPPGGGNASFRLAGAADPDRLRAAFARVGWRSARDGDRVVLTPPDAEGKLVVRTARAAMLPWFPHRGCVVVEGNSGDAARAARLLERELADAITHCSSAPAARWERRLDALAAEAAEARTLEARSILFEEAERAAAVLAGRSFAEPDASVLRWKSERLRARLAAALLASTPDAEGPRRVAAPAPALTPRLAHVLDAGGLDALSRVQYAPRWVVPVLTPWGEEDLVVDPRTGASDPDGAELLDALARDGARMFLDAGPSTSFAAPPAATAALLGSLRRELPGAMRVQPDAVGGPLEIFYVPQLHTPAGEVNAALARALRPLSA